jgi:hypothetical protein
MTAVRERIIPAPGLRRDAVKPVDSARPRLGETVHYAIIGFREALGENPHYQRAAAISLSSGKVSDNGRGPEISFLLGPYKYTVASQEQPLRSVSDVGGTTETQSTLYLRQAMRSDSTTVAEVVMSSNATIGPDERVVTYNYGSVTATIEGVPFEDKEAILKANMTFRDIL